MSVTFYLGAHHPHWLAMAGVPLFVSRNRLVSYRKLPRASTRWALDSGGFTELSQHGYWRTSASKYAADVRRFHDEIGMMDWAAPQDWMCEPNMLRKTGLGITDHQQRTIDNYLELRALAPDLPIIPVLQGWSVPDYWHHADAYRRAGVALESLPLVGVGTVCRRQHTGTATAIFASLHSQGLKLHGFGLKLTGLRTCAQWLVSADSMAWSYSGRREPPIAGHTHKNCANCMEYALDWREAALAAAESRAAQLPLGVV